MDGVDRKLLDALQKGLPLCSRPFAALAEELGITEAECLKRVAALREEGIIRRLGGVFNTRAMGFYSTLVAAVVPPGDLDRVAGVVNEYAEVTHNYAREGPYNLWFTLVTEGEDDAQAIVEDIRLRTGVEEFYLMPAVRVFKIRTHFDFDWLDQEAAEYA